MKAIFKFSALALLASALMASCAKEVDMPVEGKKITKTFTLTFAQPDTKVAVTDEGKSTWEVGDEIMIHGEGSTHIVVALTADDISADGKKAKITVEGITPYDRTDKGYTSMIYAQYPARLSPEGNFYYDACFSETNDFLMAACDVDDNLVFVNLCGIISYQVSGEFDKVVFAGNNGETVAYTNYQARVYATAEGMDVRYTTSGNIHPDPAPLKAFEATLKEGTNYIFLPAGANFTSGFTFKFYDGVDLVKIAKTEKAVNVAHGSILALGDITAKLEDYVAPTQSDHEPAEWAKDATDLSVDMQAPANCYILSDPGVYKIPAVQGNSTEPVGNVFDVELVWETYNNAEEVAQNSVVAAVDFDNDNLYFKTPETLKPGNALIAAKDDQGKIIWSWHIWIPQTDITTNTYGLYPQELMDRNLGALVAANYGEPAPVESFGMTFQWGRKDPFVGPAANSGSANATVAGTAPTAAAGQITLNEAIANPTVLGHMDDADWLTAPDNSLWQDGEKTIYDPCPAGYRIPARGDKTNPLVCTDFSAVTGWAEDAANGYVVMGDPLAVFPVAGYRDDYSVDHYSKIGQRVAYWTSYASAEKKGYLLNIRLADYGNAHTVGEGPKARGGYVRCVRIDGWEEPVPQEPQGPVEITIDGDMSDWANVEGIVSETGPYFAFKVAYDDENIYFYSKRNFRNDYWGDYGYYYYGMDEDNDQSTAMSDPQGMPGADEWVLIYPFGGSNDAPAIPDTPGNGGLNSWDKYTFPSNSLDGVIGTDFVETEFACPRSILKIQPGATVKFYSFGNKSASNIKTEAITLKIEGGSTPEEPHDPVKAEWLFSADAMADYADNFGGTAGVKSKEAGDGGMFVQSNVTPGGKIKYVQIDKTEIDKQDKASRIIGATGHPYVTGAWPGDYWLFELSDGYTYKAGTKVHISFLTRLSATGQKYWKLEYWDGAAWQSVGEMVEGVIEHEGFDTQTFMYNFEPTTATSNSLVDHTWVLAADCSNMQFRYTCMANYQFNGNGPLEAPNGGTCRIAGAAGTSPIFEVLADE